MPDNLSVSVERLFIRNGQALARSLARQKRIINSSWGREYRCVR
jgi:hypothetical protein